MNMGRFDMWLEGLEKRTAILCLMSLLSIMPAMGLTIYVVVASIQIYTMPWYFALPITLMIGLAVTIYSMMIGIFVDYIRGRR